MSQQRTKTTKTEHEIGREMRVQELQEARNYYMQKAKKVDRAIAYLEKEIEDK
jgi:hypothetical protein